MSEVEGFIVAFGAPIGLALWIVLNFWRQAKAGGSGNETLYRKIDKLSDGMADLRERVARIEGKMG